jgi:antirestriction protein ArdC
MSTPFKPLSEQIANKMIADLKTGNSIFHRPNINQNSAMPFNLESGNKYNGPSALVLLMQRRDDPRWATSNQANRNHTAVQKGATGTLINFPSIYAIQKVFDERGEPVLKENGNQRTERVKLENPQIVEAWLFNGEQMRKMAKWEKEPQQLSPADRAQQVLDNSKANLVHGGDDRVYEPKSDVIVLPEKEAFETPEKYYAEAVYQMTKWAAAPERLNRPQEAGAGTGTSLKEELRSNLAALFVSKELNLPYELGDRVGYVASFTALLKEDPAELFKAATDAQTIADYVMDFEHQIGEKQEQAEEQKASQEQVQEEEAAPVNTVDPTRLTKGEVIPHNGTEFKVLDELKNNVYKMEDLGDGRKFKMSSKDELFSMLLDARNNPQEISVDHEAALDEVFEAEEQQETGNSHAIER